MSTDDWIRLHAEVDFTFTTERVEEFETRAREIDEVNQGEDDVPETYTVEQAFQVCWHHDPEWVHSKLFGWVIEKAGTHGNPMKQVWG